MKNLKLLVVALVAMFGFTACNKDCGHEFIEYDYTEALVGTWTYDEGEQAEAIVINPDGSFTITGVMKHGALYEEKGIIKVVNNKVTLSYDSGDVFEGRLELVAGKSLSIVLFEEYDVRLTYDYCEKDLSDEILGMWVCMDTPADAESEMMIETFYDNGKSTLTGFLPLERDSEQVNNESTDYMVIGDLLFISIPADKFGDKTPFYVVHKMIYTPNDVRKVVVESNANDSLGCNTILTNLPKTWNNSAKLNELLCHKQYDIFLTYWLQSKDNFEMGRKPKRGVWDPNSFVAPPADEFSSPAPEHSSPAPEYSGSGAEYSGSGSEFGGSGGEFGGDCDGDGDGDGD